MILNFYIREKTRTLLGLLTQKPRPLQVHKSNSGLLCKTMHWLGLSRPIALASTVITFKFRTFGFWDSWQVWLGQWRHRSTLANTRHMYTHILGWLMYWSKWRDIRKMLSVYAKLCLGSAITVSATQGRCQYFCITELFKTFGTTDRWVRDNVDIH